MLSSGKVLIGGGVGYLTAGESAAGAEVAELYDPATGSFALAGAVVNPSKFPVTGNLLTSGKVLQTLESPYDYFCPRDDAELYGPLTSTFAATGRMTANRSFPSATLLPDGTLLIASGISAELYDPATGTFTSTGRMTTGRAGHTATLLPGGTVLMAGGQDVVGNFAGAIAEIYRPAVLIPSPVLLSVSGSGQGAILHASTQQLGSPDNPAVAGEALEIYLTGLTDGSVIPPQIAIGDRMAEILYFGQAPGYAGLNQVNVRVPSGVAPGPAIPMRLTYLGRPSNEVTIGVQ